MNSVMLVREQNIFLKRVHEHNFDLRGKVFDLATGSLKHTTADMNSMQSEMAEQQQEVNEKLDESNSEESNTFADVVGDMKIGLVIPMKRAMKKIEMEDERFKNIVICGLNIKPSLPKEKFRDITILETASDVIIETGHSEENVETYTVLRKIGESRKAPEECPETS